MGYPKLANEMLQDQNEFLEKINSSDSQRSGRKIKRYPYSLKQNEYAMCEA
jgi:hypothetical protein